MNTKRGKENPN